MAETPEKGETQSPEALGTEAEANQQTETVEKAQYDALLKEAEELRKEKQQAEMEKNLQRNKAKEEERKAAETAKDYDKLFQMMKEENEELKKTVTSVSTKTETDNARKEALSKLPEKLQDAAKEVLDQASSPEEVKAEVAKIEKLATKLGIEIETPQTPVTPLNPNPKQVKVPDKTKTLAEQADDLHRRAMVAAGLK